jgi:hypothetical protein
LEVARRRRRHAGGRGGQQPAGEHAEGSARRPGEQRTQCRRLTLAQARGRRPSKGGRLAFALVVLALARCPDLPWPAAASPRCGGNTPSPSRLPQMAPTSPTRQKHIQLSCPRQSSPVAHCPLRLLLLPSCSPLRCPSLASARALHPAAAKLSIFPRGECATACVGALSRAVPNGRAGRPGADFYSRPLRDRPIYTPKVPTWTPLSWHPPKLSRPATPSQSGTLYSGRCPSTRLPSPAFLRPRCPFKPRDGTLAYIANKTRPAPLRATTQPTCAK